MLYTMKPVQGRAIFLARFAAVAVARS